MDAAGSSLHWASATESAARVAAGELSPVELLDAVLDRLDRTEPVLNAFVTVCAERARSEAAAAADAVARRDELGPLHGVPFSVKDLVNTAGVRTTFGSLAFEHNVPEADAVAVARLRAAGAIIVGKTTTPEFGHKPLTEAPLFGRTANPWDPARTSGGSSGGSAAAVAAGVGPVSVGTDGGGSTRVPAAACGVVGVKQTLGVVPHDQTPDAFGLLAYVGPIARTVADAALVLELMSGPHRSDPHSLGRHVGGLAAAGRFDGDLAGVRVGWRARFGNDRVDPETELLCAEAATALSEAGAEVVEHTEPVEATYPAWGPLTFSIWSHRFARHEAALGDRMSASLRKWMAEGAAVTGGEVQAAMEVRTRLFRQVESWFEHVDLLAMPTLTRPAVPLDSDPEGPVVVDGVASGGYREGWYPYTHPFNLTGHPAVTCPAGWTAEGLPVGLQLVGPWLADAAVLRAAAVLERLRPWRDRYLGLEPLGGATGAATEGTR
jgi:aspartyl-tRNA(Asn)/glutamyl-tRNA(Gln) amidotransferase subunit A